MADSYGDYTFTGESVFSESYTPIIEPIDFPGNGRDYRASGVKVQTITQTGFLKGTRATLNTDMAVIRTLTDGEEHELICTRWPSGRDLILADIRWGPRQAGTSWSGIQHFSLTYYRITKT